MLLARYDANIVSTGGQMKRQIAENLAGGGMVGEKEAVQKDDTLRSARSPISHL